MARSSRPAVSGCSIVAFVGGNERLHDRLANTGLDGEMQTWCLRLCRECVYTSSTC